MPQPHHLRVSFANDSLQSGDAPSDSENARPERARPTATGEATFTSIHVYDPHDPHGTNYRPAPWGASAAPSGPSGQCRSQKRPYMSSQSKSRTTTGERSSEPWTVQGGHGPADGQSNSLLQVRKTRRVSRCLWHRSPDAQAQRDQQLLMINPGGKPHELRTSFWNVRPQRVCRNSSLSHW